MKRFLLLAFTLFCATVGSSSAQNANPPIVGGSSTPSTSTICSGSQALSFASSGDDAYEVTLTANCVFTVTDVGTSGMLRRLTLVIHPAGHQATLPAASGSLLWNGGSAPVPSTTTDMIVIFESTSAGRIYAHVQFS